MYESDVLVRNHLCLIAQKSRKLREFFNFSYMRCWTLERITIIAIESIPQSFVFYSLKSKLT
jgi:hypothetical protein